MAATHMVRGAPPLTRIDIQHANRTPLKIPTAKPWSGKQSPGVQGLHKSGLTQGEVEGVGWVVKVELVYRFVLPV